MADMLTYLWFDTEAEEAAEFYCSVFPDSRITSIDRAPIDTPGPKEGEVITVEFELDGRPFVGLNGGPRKGHAEFSDGVSIELRCADQAEVDHYWEGLLAGGGREVQCGWLIDRYEMRWQIVPERLYELWKGDDPEAARRAFAAMTDMIKLDVAGLEAAAAGEP